LLVAKVAVTKMREFISEDDLNTFEGWLTYQAVDVAAATPDELATWRGLFDEATKRRLPFFALKN
jgi:hypothetical protein